jgi:hypothetical protein
MGILQKAILAVVPRTWAQALEAESRAWMVQCPCGAERSVWDIGGIRYKAAGRPRWLRRCPQCGKWKWHRVYYRGRPDGPAAG